MRHDAAPALIAMGYTVGAKDEPGVQVQVTQDGPDIRIDWFIPEDQRPTEAEIDAFDMSPQAVEARENAKAREAAKVSITADKPNDKRFKALLLVTLDEINLIRSKLVPALQPRTITQLKTAIAKKIDDGLADG